MDKEEEPFQKIRLTLSDAAFEMLGELKEVSAFRSDSATVEECIRSIYDIAEAIHVQIQTAANQKRRLTVDETSNTFLQIAMRIRRFVKAPKEEQK